MKIHVLFCLRSACLSRLSELSVPRFAEPAHATRCMCHAIVQRLSRSETFSLVKRTCKLTIK